MALVAPAERDVQGAGPAEVVHVAAPPGEEARVLEALHPGPDEARSEIGHSRALPRLCAPAPASRGGAADPVSVSAPAVSPAAAVLTARTMCS